MKKFIKKASITILAIVVFGMSQILMAQRGGHFGGGGHFSGGTRFGGSFGYSRSNFGVGMSANYGRIGVSRAMPLGAIRRLPSTYSRIYFGGYPYYFYDGLFYSWYGDYYGLIAPPFGLTIGFLPRGYWGFSWGGFPYYYHSGVFYRQNNERQYEVVKAPIGAIIPSIPKEAKIVVINGEKLYEYLGTYYKEVIDENGKTQYRIEGKDGVLNNSENTVSNMPEVTISPAPNNKMNIPSDNHIVSVGDIVLQLPNNCKTVIINDKKFYVSIDNVYYEEFIENNTLKYKVVGK